MAYSNHTRCIIRQKAVLSAAKFVVAVVCLLFKNQFVFIPSTFSLVNLYSEMSYTGSISWAEPSVFISL